MKCGRYPNLCKMATSLLTCFHGPLVESSFNVLDSFMGAATSSTSVKTFSAHQTVKYAIREEMRTKPETKPRTDSAVKFFHIENFMEVPPPKNLVNNMKNARKLNEERKIQEKKEKEERAAKLGLEGREKPVTKRKSQQDALREAKRARKERLLDLVAKRTNKS